MIPWDFVDLIDRDPARRVRLKIEQDRLAKMHPSDLADILEELAPAERQALFTSLDEEVAAEALEEVEPRMQKALTESLDSEQVAGIVEEMDPAAAADFLAELPEERSEAILEEMDPRGAAGGGGAAGVLRRLGGGRDDDGLYLAAAEAAAIDDAVAALREFEGDVETLTHIFLVDEQEKLRGRGAAGEAAAGDRRDAMLAGLADDHVVSLRCARQRRRRWRSCSTSTTCARCRCWMRRRSWRA